MPEKDNKRYKNFNDNVANFVSTSKRILIYFLIIFCVAFYYLADLGLTPNYVFSLLPIAVGASFFLLLEIILSIEKKLRSLITPEQYSSLFKAFPQLEKILSQRSWHRREVKIIASTGASSFNALRELLSNSKQLDIKFLILDSQTPEIDKFAPHWKNESREVEKKIKKLQTDPILQKRKITIDYRKYSHIPMIKGFLVDDRFLLVGFYLWMQDELELELVGAENPYFFYSTDDPSAEFLHSVFQSWFENDWNNYSSH